MTGYEKGGDRKVAPFLNNAFYLRKRYLSIR